MTAAPGVGEILPLARTVGACPDPLALYRRLAGDGDPPRLLLESADTTTQQGSRSILMPRAALRAVCRGRRVEVTALGPQGERVLPWLAERLGEATCAEGVLAREYPAPPAGASEDDRLRRPSPTDVLRLLATGWTLRSSPGPMSYLIAGTFAYDLLGAYEDLPAPRADDLGWPEFEVWAPEELVVLDHRARTARVLRFVYGGPDAERSYHDAAPAIERLVAAVEAAAGEAAGPAAAAPGPAPDVRVDASDAEFAAAVERLKEHVRRGDVYQVVPSRTFSAPCPDPLATYARLRALNPSPYMFYVAGAAGILLGASPETAVKVSGAPARVEIRPIAGTRRRGKGPDGAVDPELDVRLELELRLDAKEQAEHVMLVDLARNDVARVSEPGTRAVERLLTVERYSHVMHLVSHVAGRLRSDLDALHAYVATMNMGTLTGAPKLKAAELLRRHEATRRGPYGGAVGYVTAEGDMDTAIVIRSAVVREGTAHVRAGAGVVYDSDPAAEADETRRKAAAVLQALAPGGGGGP